MKTIQDLTLNYKAKNEDRKWFEVWKPRYLDKEVTIYNAEIIIGDEEISKDGTVSLEALLKRCNDTSRS